MLRKKYNEMLQKYFKYSKHHIKSAHTIIKINNLDFKISPCTECCMLSFG